MLSGCSFAPKEKVQPTDNSGEPPLTVSEQEVPPEPVAEDPDQVNYEELQAALDKSCECEKTFKEPYKIDWSGHVMATFVSGEALGIKNFDQNSKYKQFMVRSEGLYNGESENIRVKGRLVGISCGYYNTIFHECVGDVIADSIQNIK